MNNNKILVCIIIFLLIICIILLIILVRARLFFKTKLKYQKDKYEQKLKFERDKYEQQLEYSKASLDFVQDLNTDLRNILKSRADRPIENTINVNITSENQPMAEAKQEQGSKSYTNTNTGNQNQAIQGENITIRQQSQNISDKDRGEELTQEEVITLLADIKDKIADSPLSKDFQDKAIKRLDIIADDVQVKEPNKQLIASNLKQVTGVLAEASKTTAEGKKVWENVQPIILQLAGWLKVGVDFFRNLL